MSVSYQHLKDLVWKLGQEANNYCVINKRKKKTNMKRIQRGLCNTVHEVCTKHPSGILFIERRT